MEKLFVTALLLVIFSTSWCDFAFGKENEKSFDFKIEENLADENDNGFDDRETRLEREENKEFDDIEDDENTNDDLFFSQDESEFEKRKSVDYSEWDSDERSKLNDDTEEAEGKEEEEEEVEAEKGMFKQLFEKFKNWIRKIGKRKTQD